MADGKEKPLHDQFLRHTEGVTSNLSWTCLKKGDFKKTEGLLATAQDQALPTNAVKAKIGKQTFCSKCRLRKNAEESASHKVCECPVLAQREYFKRSTILNKTT